MVFSNCYGKRPFIVRLGDLAVALPTPGTSGFHAHCVFLFHGQMEGKLHFRSAGRYESAYGIVNDRQQP